MSQKKKKISKQNDTLSWQRSLSTSVIMGAVLSGTSHEAKWSKGRGQTKSGSIDSDDNDNEVLENLA